MPCLSDQRNGSRPEVPGIAGFVFCGGEIACAKLPRAWRPPGAVDFSCEADAISELSVPIATRTPARRPRFGRAFSMKAPTIFSSSLARESAETSSCEAIASGEIRGGSLNPFRA